MSRYETALDILTRRKFAIGGMLKFTAKELRRVKKGSAYMGHQVAGIAADGEFDAMASDATPTASLMISAPQTEDEKAALADAVLAYIIQRPDCGGSQYDPTCSAAWAQYRADVAAMQR